MEPANPSAPAPQDLRQADRLYKPFPDFASWQGLTEADRDLWDRFAKGLADQRAAATPEAFGRAVEVAMRAAAVDTGAIEGLYDVDRGFTMSVATQALAWEHAMEEKGRDVRALFEAQLEAYELVLDAATKSRPVYEAWIRQLHEVLCRAQTTYRVLTPSGWQEHELVKGQYKTLPNHVRLKDGSIHAYAPVDRVAQEMHRLVDTLDSPELEAAHPILQASYVHYALVNVHPFADGNGRVARALASLYFYRAASVPLVVFANQRLAYFDALHAADTGQLDRLTRFFRDRGIDAMQIITEGLLFAEIGPPEEAAEDVKTLATAMRILGEIESELEKQESALGLEKFHFQVWTESAENYYFGNPRPQPSYKILVRMDEPLTGGTSIAAFSVFVSEDASSPFRFRLVSDLDLEMDVRMEDVFPDLAENFRLRLSNWTRSNLSRMLKKLI